MEDNGVGFCPNEMRTLRLYELLSFEMELNRVGIPVDQRRQNTPHTRWIKRSAKIPTVVSDPRFR